MGLRTKIFLPLFLATVILTSYITAVWAPRWRSGMVEVYQQSEQRHLESVAEGLVPFLLGNQLDGIYGTLDSLLSKNKVWTEIRLSDPQGRMLYPLDAGSSRQDGDTAESRVISQQITYLGTPLGTLRVTIDLSRQLSGINRWFSNLLIMMFIVMLLLLLATVAVMEQMVRKPLRSLALAAKKLADGDYSAPVPPPKRDEVGVLISSFIVMRNAIGSHAERLEKQTVQLQLLNDTLEQRVQDRTVELSEKNTELQQAYDDLKKAQMKLLQQDKLASIGQLAAGVAHEINNPMAFISSNLQTLAVYFEQVVRFDRIWQELGGDELTQPTRTALTGHRKSLDVDYVLNDGADLIEESRQGALRVTKIVQDLKSFSRVDMMQEREPVDLTRCMESALSVCNHDLKYRAEIRREYSPAPEIICNVGQLNQVFLNLLVNAGQAITPPGVISLSCRHDDSFVYAAVSDTGRGIPEEIMARIFDPFFTTKDVGEGTGLGLSISAEIVSQHGGELLVESQPGTGTTFTVKLPLTYEKTAG